MTVYLFLMAAIFSYQFKRFHRELIAELEKKTDMDVKYMTVSIFWLKTVIRLLKIYRLLKVKAEANVQAEATVDAKLDYWKMSNTDLNHWL